MDDNEISNQMDSTKSRQVILIHGIWTRGWELIPLKRRTEKAGFKTCIYKYATISRSLKDNVEGLERFINESKEESISLVGHSYGGIVACSFINRLIDEDRLSQLQIQKCIFLGTPLLGSNVARRLGRFPWFRFITGKSLEPLKRGCQLRRPGVVKCMMMAGTLNIGFGMFFIRSGGDGVVAISETKAPWIDEYHEVNTTHLGLVFSRKTVRFCMEFLSK